MSIAGLLFGQKKFFQTTKLGTFEARVKNKSTKKDIVWTSTIGIDNYNKEIIILLEGDENTPAKQQLDTANWIIENIKDLDKELVKNIHNNSQLNEKFKNFNLSDLRLECIYPLNIETNNHELSYISISDEKLSIAVLLQNKKIVEID